MQVFKNTPYSILCATGIVSLMVFVTAAPMMQENPLQSREPRPVKLISSLKGPDLFYSYCASCHGSDGTGSGPVSPALVVKIPDLTAISAKNGGTFPAKRVRNIIAGNEMVLSHGSREMPVWGPIFHQVEEDRDLGEVRLQNLTRYVESLQKK